MHEIRHGEAIDFLKQLGAETVDLIYTDPPFGTQAKQRLTRKKGGEVVSDVSYDDVQDDYMSFIVPHLVEMHRCLKSTGTLYLHLDHRWVHYVKVELDRLFGRANFVNEIIWSYDYGGRGKRCWPKKHDSVLVYSKSSNYKFNWDAIERIPYMSPGLQKDPERAAAGKVPTDVWWMSIVGTSSKERNGYPNQKPVALVSRAILASSDAGDLVIDPFAGSGTTGDASQRLGRRFMMNDLSPWAQETMKSRFKSVPDIKWI